MATPVMGDDAIAVAEEEQHLSVPVIRTQRPAVTEDNGLAGTPIFVKNLCSIFGGYCAHGLFFFVCVIRPAAETKLLLASLVVRIQIRT